MLIAERLAEVRQRIEAACRAAKRDPESVELVAVSKRHPPEAIRAAYDAGQRTFGESYAQELAEKRKALGIPDATMRFIGHLQSNKASVVVDHADAVDTVHSAKLARALAKHATGRERPLEVLIQVDFGQETSKSGVRPAALPALIAEVRAEPMLDLRGLMTLPPADLEQARSCFAALRGLAETHGLRTLSMGMSDDLEVAIAEGSTQVRVGTAIFGPRD